MRSYRIDHKNPRRLRYGWRLTPSGHIVVDPAQRRCIYLMLLLREQRFTLQQICNTLTALALPAPRQGAWYCATVRKILEQNEGLRPLLPHLVASAPGTAPGHVDGPTPPRAGVRRDLHQAFRMHSGV
ncbi:MAG: recombinase family protein [Gammaproteobacteria bacterium]